ncbi:MAG: HAD family phosphatase, partial [Anaerolineae bacterium]|nr:HAD family phosphatase [Anaerolineae bacterium]
GDANRIMSHANRDDAASTIKAVIFDVGGVLIRTHDWRGRQRWERDLALQPGQAEWLVFHSQAGLRAQQGHITGTRLWQELAARLDLHDEQLAAFRHDFWAGDALDEELVAYIRSLRPNYQTAIISNFNDSLRDSLERTYPIAGDFDLIVVSAEENVMKPDERIYHLTLERLGRQPGEAVFIDDSPANVAGARAIGMHAVHYQAGMDVSAALAALGVRPADESVDTNRSQEN